MLREFLALCGKFGNLSRRTLWLSKTLLDDPRQRDSMEAKTRTGGKEEISEQSSGFNIKRPKAK